MPKINGKNIDPKVYAKRVTEAKKAIGKMDPELKRKIAQMYPKGEKEQIINKQLGPKKAAPKATATAKVKITGKASTSGGRAANTPSITNRGSIAQSPKIISNKPKVSVSKPNLKSPSKASKSPMPKKVTGEAAARQYQKEISQKGMASAKAAQSKALDKKYPGLYKKSK